MNADQVTALRILLGPSGWLEQTRFFARALRGRAPRGPGELLLVGTPDDEPWHLAAHLDQESRLAGIPGLAPTLVRWSPPPAAPPHLRVGLTRLDAARRGQSTIGARPEAARPPLAARAHTARPAGPRDA